MTLSGRTGTLVIVALVVSICLNLLVAGMIIGHRWHGGPDRMGPFGGPPGGAILREMPEEARPLIKTILKQHKSDFEARRDAMQQARRRVAEILQAEAIDQGQLDAALKDLQQRSQELQQLGHTVLIEVAQKLPPDLRRDWARKWGENLPDEPPEPKP